MSLINYRIICQGRLKMIKLVSVKMKIINGLYVILFFVASVYFNTFYGLEVSKCSFVYKIYVLKLKTKRVMKTGFQWTYIHFILYNRN